MKHRIQSLHIARHKHMVTATTLSMHCVAKLHHGANQLCRRGGGGSSQLGIQPTRGPTGFAPVPMGGDGAGLCLHHHLLLFFHFSACP